MPQVRKSRQRDAILQNLQQRCDHPTAMELYLSVRAEMPNLSLGTVYRNLNMLACDGVILRISFKGADRFDGNKMLHYHFRCLECGKVYDIDMPTFDGINLKAQAFAKGRINSHELVFSGVCDECLDAEKN